MSRDPPKGVCSSRGDRHTTFRWSSTVLYPEGSVLTVGRPRCCTPRDRCYGPYTIAIVIMVGALPRGVGATGPTLSPSSSLPVLYTVGSVLTVGRPRCCTPRDHHELHYHQHHHRSLPNLRGPVAPPPPASTLCTAASPRHVVSTAVSHKTFSSAIVFTKVWITLPSVRQLRIPAQ